MSEFSRATEALAELGVRAEFERQEAGTLLLHVVGEVVDGRADEEGVWVTVLPQPPASDAERMREP